MVEANKADDSGKDNGQFEDLIDGKYSTHKRNINHSSSNPA